MICRRDSIRRPTSSWCGSRSAGEGSIELAAERPRAARCDRWATPSGRGRSWPRTVMLEASVFDRRLRWQSTGSRFFDPFDYDDPVARPPGERERRSPWGCGAGRSSVNDLRIFRDIYYTSSLAQHPAASSRRESSRISSGTDEYFVLGDNSPVSNDSRFWTGGPVVPGRCSWASRSWCICPGRLWRSRSSAGRFAGFPIRGESGTFGNRSRSLGRSGARVSSSSGRTIGTHDQDRQPVVACRLSPRRGSS